MDEDFTLEKNNFPSNENPLTVILCKAMDIIEDGIHIVDKKGVTVFYSAALEKIENNRSSNVVGKHIREVYKLDEDSSILLKVLRSGVAVKNHHTTYLTQKGTEINIITNTYPIYNDSEIIGAVSINSNITSNKQLVDTVIDLQRQLYSNVTKNGTRYTFKDIIGESIAINNAVKLAQRIALNMSPVLIYGETGTGKELFAQSIHNHSLRANGPFLAVNCAAIPETLLESVLFGTSKGAFTGAEDKTGLFEEADQGTLFLDEISSMNITLQSKLLRVIESKMVRRLGGKTDIKVNPRIISAINSDPHLAIKKNRLRQDLYYRLAVVTLSVPPLRDRMSDIPLLMHYFVKTINRIMNKKVRELSPDIVAVFQQHNWPGNVRELQHAVEHAMNYAEDETETLELRHIPPHFLKKYSTTGSDLKDTIDLDGKENSLKEILQQIEIEIIKKTMDKNDHNITRTAQSLGMSRQNLQQRLRRLEIRD
ncbi:MAG: sigma 54-interacting transcriptional regulator [Bacillota bacterium]|nr:sigma 54-interacting transcriptional regulator [Bacillota bacterium]MDW7730071.1 sigma 54-interacting transcriptional regulator [Bacillota bacterium]